MKRPTHIIRRSFKFLPEAALIFCLTLAASSLTSSGRAATDARSSDPAAAAGSGPTIGPSGLPIPRFVSLGASKVYVRTGPGKQYPIDWVYARKNLPLEVIAEYDIWRRVRDQQGSIGWVHGSMLSGRRMVTIENGTQTIFYKPDTESRPVMRAEKDVIGELRRCRPGWCEIQIEGKRGWVQIADIWGTNSSDIRK